MRAEYRNHVIARTIQTWTTTAHKEAMDRADDDNDDGAMDRADDDNGPVDLRDGVHGGCWNCCYRIAWRW